MDDARGVSLGERLCGVVDHAHGSLGVDQANARHAIVERLAFEELHADERAAIFETARVVDVDDVRAPYARRRAGLTEEALDDDGRRRQLGREHLDGDFFAERRVLSLVNGCHAAATDFAGHPILPNQEGSRGDLRLVRNRTHSWRRVEEYAIFNPFGGNLKRTDGSSLLATVS